LVKYKKLKIVLLISFKIHIKISVVFVSDFFVNTMTCPMFFLSFFLSFLFSFVEEMDWRGEGEMMTDCKNQRYRTGEIKKKKIQIRKI
jgi:hypothetical protein